MTRTTLLAVICFTSVADAGELELGAMLGGHAFASDAELGVGDGQVAAGTLSGTLLGARIGYSLDKRFAAEAEAVAIPTRDDVFGDRVLVVGLRAHARFDVTTGRLRPFVVAGAGLHVLRSASPVMASDIDQALHWGGGVRWAFNDRLEARLDLRHLIVPDRNMNGATSDLEITAGVTFRLGGTRATPPRTNAYYVAPPPPPPPVQVIEPGTGAGPRIPAGQPAGHALQPGELLIEQLVGIEFEPRSATIHGSSAPVLERAYQLLEANPGLSIEVGGHTSADGAAAYNLDLSQQRAEAVRTYLIKRGIAATRVRAVGYGAGMPLAPNTTESGRRKNRRIELRVIAIEP